jgi:hypothetical protein
MPQASLADMRLIPRGFDARWRCLVLGLALGCRDSAPEPGGGEDNGRGRDGLGGEPLPTPVCTREETYGPEGPVHMYACENLDSRYLTGELVWTYEEPTPAGEYSCTCMEWPGFGEPVYRTEKVDAESCASALQSVCAVDLKGPLACSASSIGGDAAVCWPVLGAPGSWRCRCAAGGELIPIDNDDCRQAWRAACL